MLGVLVIVTTVVTAVTAGEKFNGADRPPTGAPGGVIVNLFEWRYDEIAKECEKFLGPNGYAGVQVSPVAEHAVLKESKGWDSFVKKIPFNDFLTNTQWYKDVSTFRPWTERYQPASYKIFTRSGDEAAFKDMVSRCNKVGVKVYVEVVFNHMTGNYPKDGAAGIAGSPINSPQFKYPAVPYNSEDFNQPTCAIKDFNDLKQLRLCEDEGLHDLNQTSPCVRQKMRTFLNTLISMGVAGFRVNKAHFMNPADLNKLFAESDFLGSEHGFRAESVPYVYYDIPNDKTSKAINLADYYAYDAVMNYSYAAEVSAAFSGAKQLKELEKLHETMETSHRLKFPHPVVFVDTHLTQRGVAGNDVLTHTKPKQYRMAVAFVLAYPYGEPQIMSSYRFGEPMEGPPSDKDGKIDAVTFDAKGCANGWVCEHRWKPISNMVKFRNAVKDEKLANWAVHGPNQISFGRGNKGFVVFNGEEGKALKKTIQTGLPEGVYCDVTSGSVSGNDCTGKKVTVDSNGNAAFSLDDKDVIAIHEGAKIKT